MWKKNILSGIEQTYALSKNRHYYNTIIGDLCKMGFTEPIEAKHILCKCLTLKFQHRIYDSWSGEIQIFTDNTNMRIKLFRYDQVIRDSEIISVNYFRSQAHKELLYLINGFIK